MNDHTLQSYNRDLADLHGKIIRMGDMVERMIGDGMGALLQRDDTAAQGVIDYDHQVNRLEVEIDELSIDLVARYQPVAVDLRVITTALKISTDLERMGDQAVNICEQVIELNKKDAPPSYFSLPAMAERARRMVHEAMRAYEARDPELAQQVCDQDDEVNRLHAGMFHDLFGLLSETPERAQLATRLMFVSKYLERIADHATNISEMTIYMVKGKGIRHIDDGTIPS
jgi:phosphate transport system protein